MLRLESSVSETPILLIYCICVENVLISFNENNVIMA